MSRETNSLPDRPGSSSDSLLFGTPGRASQPRPRPDSCSERPARGREPRESVDHGQNPQLLARRQLVMNEVHRPDIVRPDGHGAVIAQLRLHPPLRRLVPELQPRVLVFKLRRPPHLVEQKARILLLRAEVGRLADPGLAADLRDRRPVFALLDDERLSRAPEPKVHEVIKPRSLSVGICGTPSL